MTTIHMEMDMEWTPPLKHHYPIKCQQAYTIINVCVYVNTIQKQLDMEMDMEKIPSQSPLHP